MSIETGASMILIPSIQEKGVGLKGSQKPRKPQKKVAQKTLKERRVEKRNAALEHLHADRTRA